jgi:glycosyltransferase involved in cell wall biosynthesis
MEAMAAGCAVVASDLSGIPELIETGTSGILVPPGDAMAIAAALADLARSPPARHRLGAAARQRVIDRFNLPASASGLAELISGTADNQLSPSAPAAAESS